MKPGYKTTEFAAVVASLLVTVLVLLGFVEPGDEETLAEALVDMVAAFVTLAANAAVVIEYIRNRTQLKAKR